MDPRTIARIDIPATNRETTAQFYSQAFGWTFHHADQQFPYTFFATGNLSGGFPDMGDPYTPGTVVIYITSDDLEADLQRIELLGGRTLLSPLEVPGHGSIAMFADPNGHRLALWKPLRQTKDSRDHTSSAP